MGNNSKTINLPTMGEDTTGEIFDEAAINRNGTGLPNPEENIPNDSYVDRLKQNDERLNKELNQLYTDEHDAYTEKQFLRKELEDSLTKIREAEEKYNYVRAHPGSSNQVIDAAERELEQAQQEHGRVNRLYRDANNRFNEIEQRINELETGFSF